MTTILQAIILGIVQGITEWLPISSSGHLVIMQHLFNITPPLLFDVMLHFGTLIVIFLVFWQDIKKIALSLFNKKYKNYRKILYFIIIGSIPIALVGYFLHDSIESLFTNIRAVAIALIFTGALLYLSELKKEKKRKLTLLDSILVGIMQAVALVPGVSRSGSTISTALILGVKRIEAARFSYLLVIPAIIGATVYEITNISQVTNTIHMIIGTIVAIVVGYFSLRWLLKLIQKKKFSYFSYYCWALAVIVFLISLF